MDLPDNLEDLLVEITKRGFSASNFAIANSNSRVTLIVRSKFPAKFTDYKAAVGEGKTTLEATKNAVERIISAEKW